MSSSSSRHRQRPKSAIVTSKKVDDIRRKQLLVLEKLVAQELLAEEKRELRVNDCESEAERQRVRTRNMRERRNSKQNLSHIMQVLGHTSNARKGQREKKKLNNPKVARRPPRKHWERFSRTLAPKLTANKGRKQVDSERLALERERAKCTARQIRNSVKAQHMLRKSRRRSGAAKSARMSLRGSDDRRGKSLDTSNSNVRHLLERKRDLLRQYRGIIREEMAVAGMRSRRSSFDESAGQLGTSRSVRSTFTRPLTASTVSSGYSDRSLASLPRVVVPKPDVVPVLDLGGICGVGSGF